MTFFKKPIDFNSFLCDNAFFMLRGGEFLRFPLRESPKEV